MTAPTPTVEWHRRRTINGKETHYLTIDGQPAKLTLEPIPMLRLNYKAPTGKRGPVLAHGYDGYFYNHSERQWDEKAGTHFYPYADKEHAAAFRAAYDATEPHLDN